MTTRERPGPLRRMLASLGAALSRGLLGKASDSYMRQFNGEGDRAAQAPDLPGGRSLGAAGTPASKTD